MKKLFTIMLTLMLFICTTAQAELDRGIFKTAVDTLFENSTDIVEIKAYDCYNILYGEERDYEYPFVIQLTLLNSDGSNGEGEKNTLLVRGYTGSIIQDPVDAVILANYFNEHSRFTKVYVEELIDEFYFNIEHASYCVEETPPEEIFYNVGLSVIEIHEFVEFLKSNEYKGLNGIEILPKEWADGTF